MTLFSPLGHGRFPVSFSGCRDVEAGEWRSNFTRHRLLPPQVQEHFSQQIFQVLLVDGPRGVEAVEASVGDVERCSELMGGTVCGVAADAPQTFHGIRVRSRLKHKHAVAAGPARGERVDEIASDAFQKARRFRHEIRHRVFQRVDFVPPAAFLSAPRDRRVW